jgi:hypothetical protein
LYPRWWRDATVADVSGGDAHFHGRPGMKFRFADAAVRRGLYDGLIVSGVLIGPY